MSAETLTREDMLRAQLGLSLDTVAKRQAYMDVLVAKWGEAGWLNAELCKGDRSKKFHERLLKARTLELDNSDYELGSMAIMLDNQRAFQREHEFNLPVRMGADGQPYVHLVQDTTTADEALPTRAVMPIIRRLYALVLKQDFSRVQPMAGPNSYVFWLDFIREADNSNLLSIEYNQLLTPELGVPPKGKLKLSQRQITAVKQMVGVAWSTEAEEDAKALLNLNIETELMREFGNEFVRDLFMRHLTTVYNASLGNFDPSIGASLPGIWTGHLPSFTIPNKGSQTDTDYKQSVYNTLLQADAQFMRANRYPSNVLMCGYGFAAFLQSMNTATGANNPDMGFLSSVGISNYGTYAARFEVRGTEFLADNVAIMYRSNPDVLHAGHVYAPYVPVQAGPKIYADYDATTGAFLNKDAWTRTLRERSAEIVTKPYAFQLILAPTGGLSQW